jgi:predicted pyridoxine 5'-phosphate oxidase superfamily flavin-nucleotide-binding protein
MIDDSVKKYIDKSVLCWLATCDNDFFPNVSPKEMFTYRDDSTLLIANLASPNSIKNIIKNPNVCVSFVDVFVQKGYKLQGKATIIDKADLEFNSKVKPLTDLFTDKFPIKSVIEISVTKVDTIQAPSYFLYSDTTEENQIKNAMTTYNVKPN